MASRFTASDESLLLALPMELLVRTTDFLDDNSLAVLRLTCKTLDANYSVKQLVCCALFNERLTRIHNIFTKAPRLLKKVQWATFTFDILEERELDSISVVPNQEEDINDAQMSAASAMSLASEPVRGGIKPDMSVMYDLLETIAERNIGLCMNFAGLSAGDCVSWPIHRMMLLVLSYTDPLLDAVVLTPGSCASLAGLPSQEKRAMLNTAHFTDSISYFPGAYRLDGVRVHHADDSLMADKVQGLNFATSFIRLANHLQYFHLNLATYERGDRQAMTSRLLLAGDFAALQHLKIYDTEVSGSDLLLVLDRCKHTLIHFCAGSVSLRGDNVSWEHIFQKLASLPRLSDLLLDGMV